MASVDFECSSTDKSVEFNGKTYETENHEEKFLSELIVKINKNIVARIRHEDLNDGSTPNKFIYLSDSLQIHFNWEDRFLSVKHHPESFEYSGQLQCW